MSDAGSISPEPIGPSSGKKKGSPWKWVGIGCGAIILILVIGVAVLYTQRAKIMKFGISKMTDAVIQALPADIDREEAAQVADRLADKMLSGKIENPEEFGEKMRDASRLFSQAQQDGNLSPEEAAEIYEIFKELAGVESSGPSEPSE